MKRITVLHLFFWILAAGFLFSGCVKDQCETEYTYKIYQPVYMSYDELRVSVASMPPRAIIHPGKIYLRDNYFYINEIDRGVHIIDNSDPANPQKIGFISIPGNIDLAVRDNILYADSFTDLVAIDIANPAEASETGRIENLLPGRWDGFGYNVHPDSGVVVQWNEEEITQTFDCNGNYWGGPWLEGDVFSPNSGGGGDATQTTNGQAGSMARFALVGAYLYTIDNNSLHTVDVSFPGQPVESGTVNVGFGIETLFPYEDKLFIGASNGMYIYNNSNPVNPYQLSVFLHVNSCDPVVVENDIAYVTLRSGTVCNGFTNQLDVIDVSDPVNPFLIKSYPMYNPHGLGIDDNTLFICDGDEGLKVYDATDKEQIDENKLGQFSDINAYDVIPWNNRLMLIGKDGFYQYDYSDPSNVQLISVLPVVN